jgi:lipopolysaccharide export LptBFGC system permease protein LptF
VLGIGMFLIMVGEVVGKMGRYIEAFGKGRAWAVIEFLVLRFPELMSTWLPISVAVAALLTAWPMLRQGTLVALSASGLPPRRIFAVMVLFAVAVGALAFVLRDQVVPRLAEPVDNAWERMSGRLRAGEVPPRSAGWREGDRFWCARWAKPDEGEFRQLAVFPASGAWGGGTVALIERMVWSGGAWKLMGVQAITAPGAEPLTFIACPPETIGLSISGDPAAVADRLTIDARKSSDELFRTRADKARSTLALRVYFSLLPLLCLLFALPGFVQLEGRSRLGAVVARTLALLAVPLVGSWVLGRLLVAHGTHAFAACLTVAGILLLIGGWRWWTMRL